MIPDSLRTHIERTLGEEAARRGARVLYAAESGSRAWGFGSPDSDWDVRFIYAHPGDWYVSLREERDVIERPLDDRLIDLSGWDVRKALRLLLRSNPTLYEWLVSPIVYFDDGDFRMSAKALFEAHASPFALAAHYWSIAHSQWRREVDGAAEVKLKKYFYLVRPLLSLLWVAKHGTPPPMTIDALLAAAEIPAATRGEIGALLERKRAAPELGLERRLPAIDDWAADALGRFAPERLVLSDKRPRDGRLEADALFRRVIGVRGL